MRRVLLVLVLLVVAGIGLWKFFEVPPSPAETMKRYNVLFLTADSFNRRHLPFYGYHRNTMPYLSGLAEDALVFDRMINPSGWTNENLVSIFSGLSSPIHKVETRGRNLDPAWVTPLEILRECGYRLPRLEGWQGDQNHDQLGFEPVTIMHPAEWIEKNGRSGGPFFLFHQFLQPHLPYNGYCMDTPLLMTFFSDTMFRTPAAKKRIMETVFTQTVIKNDGDLVFEPTDSEAIHAFYDGELLILDREIRRTVEALEKAGLRENTIIIFGADHGEELLEHGFVGHASTSRKGTLYDEIVHTPFLILFPKELPRGGRVRQQVRGIDVMPTVLDLLGLPPQDYLEGRSMLPILRGLESGDRLAFVQTSRAGYGESDPARVTDHIRAVTTPEWKLIQFNFEGEPIRYELFHLRNDPYEQVNLADSLPQRVVTMSQQIIDWGERCARMRPPAVDPFSRKSWYRRLRDWLFPRGRGVDLTGVPSPPVIQTPPEGAVVTANTDRGRAVIRWNGRADVPYVIEYKVGEGDYRLDGFIEVDGNEKIFGPFEGKYWNTYLTLYSPYAVRVSIDKEPREWSPWLHFTVKAAGEETR